MSESEHRSTTFPGVISCSARVPAFAQIVMHDRSMSEARDRVTAAALRMFSEHGYAGVSMRDLAKELNIQAPSIYSHFVSKDALLVATLLPFLDELDAVLAKRPTGDTSDPAVQRAWVERYVDYLRRNWVAVRFMVSDQGVERHPDLRPKLTSQHERVRDILQSFGVDDAAARVGIVGFLAWPAMLTAVDAEVVYGDPRFLDETCRLIGLSRARSFVLS
jgi:AcrR family transcriptional regulator